MVERSGIWWCIQPCVNGILRSTVVPLCCAVSSDVYNCAVAFIHECNIEYPPPWFQINGPPLGQPNPTLQMHLRMKLYEQQLTTLTMMEVG
ncbi:predicted protein [Lichtheimia corymbifera JMRC:FSU:9682]|uniref:Uncharacterized protein n=1 Tax=Lichtheimia corymbifera JMRC:FSU:9682 TaxID=1263082 RepID=A0A068RU41_9FUNG|nr:predicted protein [Lichtheimia corymbifera JMRC:FSU:9682]